LGSNWVVNGSDFGLFGFRFPAIFFSFQSLFGFVSHSASGWGRIGPGGRFFLSPPSTIHPDLDAASSTYRVFRKLGGKCRGDGAMREVLWCVRANTREAARRCTTRLCRISLAPQVKQREFYGAETLAKQLIGE
jgi:hypothetical protein